MASTSTSGFPSGFQVTQPEQLDFQTPNWTKWFQRFQRFRLASGLSTKSEEEQINMLIYVMGDTAEDVLKSFTLADDDLKKYAKVTAAFENHYVTKRNPTYERAKFNRRVQEDGETVEQYLTALYTLSEHCNFQTLREQFIMDRIVVGVKSQKLSQQLQMDSKLTLDKAIAVARNFETVQHQQEWLQGAQSTSVNEVRKSGISQETSRSGDSCPWCGRKERHDRKACPASGRACNKCNRKGHFQIVCQAASVNSVRVHSGSLQSVEDMYLLG